MLIGIIKELHDPRCAATTQTAQQFKAAGFDVIIEAGAGQASGFSDEEYKSVGAIIKPAAEILKTADILLKVTAISKDEASQLKHGAIIIGNFEHICVEAFHHLQALGTFCFALEQLPRLSRAQAFDILSSQNNLAGYRAVIKAAELTKDVLPLMITSAGTLPPLKVLVIGVCVAGLQAIATAKRLGAKVFASDPREETQDQVKSLGATFVEDINSILPEADIIIASAFALGKKAPLIISAESLKNLKKTAVLIDMAAAFGGNIEGSQNGHIIHADSGQIICGNSNLAAEIPSSASRLLANNFYNYVMYLHPDTAVDFTPNFADPLIETPCIVKG